MNGQVAFFQGSRGRWASYMQGQQLFAEDLQKLNSLENEQLWGYGIPGAKNIEFPAQMGVSESVRLIWSTFWVVQRDY